jgi:hypothetical protein
MPENCQQALITLLKNLAKEIGDLVNTNHHSIAFTLRVAIEFGLNSAGHNLLPDRSSFVNGGFAMKTPMDSGSQVRV